MSAKKLCMCGEEMGRGMCLTACVSCKEAPDDSGPPEFTCSRCMAVSDVENLCADCQLTDHYMSSVDDIGRL